MLFGIFILNSARQLSTNICAIISRRWQHNRAPIKPTCRIDSPVQQIAHCFTIKGPSVVACTRYHQRACPVIQSLR